MQLAQFTGIGLVVMGGLLAFLLRSGPTSGMANAVAQMLSGIVVGLLGASAILVWTNDLVPDDVEWLAAAGVAGAVIILLVVVRFRQRG